MFAGLLHFNHNQQCYPLVFTQFFNNADPGSINVVGALAAMSNTSAASIRASNVTASTSAQRAFALDQVNLDLSHWLLCLHIICTLLYCMAHTDTDVA